MLKQSKPKTSLKKRIIISFCLLSLFISLIFSVLNFLLAYKVEDDFFEQLIAEEIQYIQQTWQETVTLPKPSKRFINYYFTLNDLPSDLYLEYQKKPKQKEYSGEQGRHYHLYYVNKPQLILVAEVSEHLIVRPLKAQILTLLFSTSLAMLILALAVSYFFGKIAINPLEKLSTLLSTTSPEQLPTQFSNDFPNNEIGFLATILESAMARIEAFIAREQHFTRDASHELRTPVTIIKNALELLQTQDLTPKQRTLIERIELANRQMEQTITALLSLAREKQTVTSNNTHNCPTRLLPIIEQTIIDQSYLIAAKNIELEINICSADSVNCPTAILQILLNNLIANAFQYTAEGTIHISCSNNILSISDSGGGIEEAIQAQVLKPLVKGKNSQGYGLGLSIVHRLCETYQLTLKVNSSAQGLNVYIDFNE